MTRETKIGMVVACSFLCLVGIVVASKWRNGDTATKEPELQEIYAGAKEGQPGNPPIEPAKKSEGRPGDHPTDKGVAPLPLPVNSINPPNKTEAQVQQELRDAKKQAEHAPPGTPLPFPALPSAQGGPLPLPALPVSPGPFNSGPTVQVDSKGPAGLPLPLVPPVDANVSTLPKAEDPLHGKKNGGVTLPNPEGARPLGGIDIAQGGNGKPVDPLPALPQSKDPLPSFPPQPKDPLPMVAKDPLPSFPPQSKDPLPIVAKDPLPSFPPQSKDPLPMVAKDPLPSFPPQPKDPLPMVAKDPLPSFPPQPKDPLPIVAKDPLPSFPPQPKDPLPIGAKDPLPSFPPQQAGPIPQIPRETAPGLPPIIVGGGKPPLPIVKETSLDEYECRQGDSTFANLSMRFYGTDKYADALLLYNRAHSGMVRNGSNLTVNPPILTPGQPVLNPPKEVLERDYRLAVAPLPANPGVAPSIKLTPPTPLLPVPNGGAAPIANPPVGGTYTVQNPNGESILDIAERVLGNRSRWTAIYDLNRANPAVQPQFRIPVGTSLKMPAN